MIAEWAVENTIQRLQYFTFWRRLAWLPSSAHIRNVRHVLHTQTYQSYQREAAIMAIKW